MSYPKVAIAVPIFPNLVQTYILNQLVAFKKIGIHFSIVAKKKQDYYELPTYIKEHGLLNDVIYVNTDLLGFISFLHTAPISNSQYRSAIIKLLSLRDWNEYNLQYRLKAAIRSKIIAFRPFDILHSHSMFSSFNHLFIKEVLSIPIVTTYHGQVPKGVNKLPLEKQMRVFKNSDAFIVNTNYSKDDLMKLGCPFEKIFVLPQGINLDNFHFNNRTININEKIKLLTVGRLSYEKGHHIAIEALSTLHKQYPTLEYHIVGEGPEKSNLIARCQKLGLTHKVIFHGFKTGIELQRIYSGAHIFVLPSIINKESDSAETQGVVLQEAQANGIPSIASNIGGIPEIIINHKTGLLFEESDQIYLAHNIKILIENSRYYTELAYAGRHDVERRFDIKVISLKLIDIYNQVLQNNHSLSLPSGKTTTSTS